MNQEQSTADKNPEAGLMDPQANEARFSRIEARVDHLEALVLNSPDFRLARVQTLKAQITAGTYDVPAEKVAAALLDYMRGWAA
jgi:flagellar biosynthesis anti-sigma factor FlgM